MNVTQTVSITRETTRKSYPLEDGGGRRSIGVLSAHQSHPRGEPEQQWPRAGPVHPGVSFRLSKSTLPFSLALIGIIHGDAHFVHVLGGGEA
jgi:hypothetical protein